MIMDYENMSTTVISPTIASVSDDEVTRNYSFVMNVTGPDDTLIPNSDFRTYRDKFGMTITVLSAAGILGNLLSVWVWQTETAYNATVLLFKYLAIWDILYLCFVIAFVNNANNRAVYHAGNLAQLLSVHTTLQVAVFRWMAVIFPMRMRTLMSRTRVVGSCVFLFLWCSGWETAQVCTDQKLVQADPARVFIAKRVVGLILPLVLLLVLSVSLLWKAWRRPQLSSLSQDQAWHSAAERNTRRLTMAIVCISLSCFLAYPLGVVAQLLYDSRQGGRRPEQLRFLLAHVAWTLQVINSGISVLFYWAFASRFRELVRFKLRCLLERRMN